MRKVFVIGGVLTMAAIMLVGLSAEQSVSFTSGAPSGRTGSPGDGADCATSGCHASSPGTPSGLEVIDISSNIPATGYVPGNTYDFTTTMTDSSISKFGFQVSPQNAAGDILGTLIAGPETGLVGLGGYVTHDFMNTDGDGQRTWAFQWTAPAFGTGDVTFYGAYNFTDDNGTASGDVIMLMDTTFSEEINISVSEVDGNALTVYPNPSNGNFRLNAVGTQGVATYELYDLNGTLISSGATVNGNVSIERVGVPNGVYMLSVLRDGNQSLIKLLLN